MDDNFKVEQLRYDKIIYGVEAAATNLACLLVYLLGRDYFVGASRDVLMLGSVVTGVVYTLYMGIGNGLRLSKIRKMEKRMTTG